VIPASKQVLFLPFPHSSAFTYTYASYLPFSTTTSAATELHDLITQIADICFDTLSLSLTKFCFKSMHCLSFFYLELLDIMEQAKVINVNAVSISIAKRSEFMLWRQICNHPTKVPYSMGSKPLTNKGSWPCQGQSRQLGSDIGHGPSCPQWTLLVCWLSWTSDCSSCFCCLCFWNVFK
jgi:hypothetical protein